MIAGPRRRAVSLSAAAATAPVLVTGATGCIGGALVPRLLAEGVRVRCLVRDAERLTAPWKDDIEIVVGPVEDDRAVEEASRGCALAYYLVHGLDGPLPTLAERERAAAIAFRDGAARGRIRRIVYLGGLVDEDELARTSEHLYARQQVGAELRAGGAEVVELRAGIVLAPDSASVALLQAAARLPLQVWGAWSAAQVQPIALADLLEVLLEAGRRPGVERAVLDVGGPDVLTYEALVDAVRRAAGRSRARRLRSPYLPVEAAAPIAAALADIEPGLALSLLQSVRGDSIVRDPRGTALFAGQLRSSLADAVAAAVA